MGFVYGIPNLLAEIKRSITRCFICNGNEENIKVFFESESSFIKLNNRLDLN